MKLDNKKFIKSVAAGLLFGSREYVPFVVITRSRTGSSLLMEGIGSGPNVITRGEVFRKSRWPSNRFFLRRVWGRHRSRTAAVGFKIFYYHPNDRKDESLWSGIRDTENLRIIYLDRKDTLSLVLSGELASRRKSYHNYDKDENDSAERFHVDVSSVLADLENISNLKKLRQKQFEGCPSLFLDYSDLVNDPAKAFKDCAQFLDVPYFEPDISLKPTAPVKYEEVFENYDELVSSLQHHGWI